MKYFCVVLWVVIPAPEGNRNNFFSRFFYIYWMKLLTVHAHRYFF